MKSIHRLVMVGSLDNREKVPCLPACHSWWVLSNVGLSELISLSLSGFA